LLSPLHPCCHPHILVIVLTLWLSSHHGCPHVVVVLASWLSLHPCHHPHVVVVLASWSSSCRGCPRIVVVLASSLLSSHHHHPCVDVDVVLANEGGGLVGGKGAYIPHWRGEAGCRSRSRWWWCMQLSSPSLAHAWLSMGICCGLDNSESVMMMKGRECGDVAVSMSQM